MDGEPVTHAGLDDQAGRMAAWLARRVQPGDRVLLAAGASVGFVRCYLGALRAGAVVVLASPGYTAAELGHLVADSGAVLAFADPEPARRLAGLGPRGAAPLPTADVRELPEQAGHRDRAPAGRYGAARVHLGHDRQAQGGAADPPPGGGLPFARRWRPGDGMRMTCSCTRCRCSTSTAWAAAHRADHQRHGARPVKVLGGRSGPGSQ